MSDEPHESDAPGGGQEPPRFLPPEPPGGYPPTQPPPAAAPPEGFPPPSQPPPGYAHPPGYGTAPGYGSPPPGYGAPPPGYPPYGYGYPPAPPSYPGYQQPYGHGPQQHGQWQAAGQAQERRWRGRKLAGWWPRVGAAVLDGLILAIPVAGLSLGLGELIDPGSVDEYFNGGGDAIGVNVGFVLVELLAYLLYKGFLMSRAGKRNGQTVGMQLVGIRVVREDEQPVSWGTVVVRETLIKGILFRYVAVLTLFVATLLNYLWPLWDGESRALHDMLARTRVLAV